MGFNSFRVNVFARVLLLCLLGTFSVWGFLRTGWQVTPVLSGALAVLAFIELIRYVESVNRELASFLDFISHHDFSARFPIGEKGKVFKELDAAYQVLAGTYRSLNLEKAASHQYLESVVEHVHTALVCLDDDDTVTLFNRHAKDLLKLPAMHSIRSFRKINPKLPMIIAELRDGDRRLVDLEIDGEPMQIAIFATEFRLLNETHKLISFQDIRDELEQREVDFSQKLIRVLTHEIMNSVTPIISLSKVIEESLEKFRSGEISARDFSEEEQDDLVRSVASIQSRGSGLLRFVQAYSRLTNLPQPEMSDVRVESLLRQVETMMGPTMEADKLEFQIMLSDPDLTVRVDQEQVQQVLINLVKNAVEALEGREGGRIIFSAEKDRQDKVLIQIADNGPGIEPDQLDKIFVPFFTTKRQGTGVGLSVSRQIMFQNKGLISARSAPGMGSEFTLRFG